MKIDPHVETSSDPRTGRFSVMMAFENRAFSSELLQQAFRQAVELIAARWAAEHYADVAAHLDPRAVANLAVASAGAAINQTLQKKLPDKVVEILRTEREVWERQPDGSSIRVK